MTAAALLAAAWLVLAPSSPSQEATGYDRALELAGRGELVEALAAADREPDALRRAQARVYVLYRGRDFLGALAAARAGLQRAPDDPWLLERAAACGLSLQAVDVAREFARRLLAAAPGPEGRADAAAHLEAAAALEARDQLVDEGARRARSTALALLAVTVALLIVLAHGVAQEGRREPAA